MKKIFPTLAAVVVIAVGGFFTYTHPKDVNRTFSGVEYRAGMPSTTVKPVAVKVTGTLQRSIRGILTFQGTIELQGNTQLNPDNHRPLTVRFNGKGGMGIFGYGYFINGTPVVHGYGRIFINDHFSKLVILETKGGWWSSDGLTIAGSRF